MKTLKFCFWLSFLLITACNTKKEAQVVSKKQIEKVITVLKDTVSTILETASTPALTYKFYYKSDLKHKDSLGWTAHLESIAAINRVDMEHLYRLDSFLIPSILNDSLSAYLPFPTYYPSISDIDKIIFFSYATQSFAAYQNGKLFLAGPTNMGKKKTPTPTGLYYCNWKSKEAISTVDKTWILKWNFNVINLDGVGFHQYDLPGYPASHSCMRLWAKHAEQLYYWADQWLLSSKQKLVAKGTPVLIFGSYPWSKPRPWFALAQEPQALNYSFQSLDSLILPLKAQILEAQQQRKDSLLARAKTNL